MSEEVKDKKNEFEYYVHEKYVESWIQGYPLKTKYGYIKPIKVKDYFKHASAFEFLKKQGWEVERLLLKDMKDLNDKVKSVIKNDLKNHTFITCVKNNVAGLRDMYNEIFSMFIHDFKPNAFYWTLTQDEFDSLRKLILDFNHIFYREKNPNPEIEKFNRFKNYINYAKGGVIEFDTVFSSLMTKEGGGHSPEEINNLTIRQFYLAFNRIEFNKANEMTILFKTVDAKGDIEVVDWNKSFRSKDDDNTFDTTDELKKNIFLRGKQ